MRETKTIEIPVYRDSDGKPFCNECVFRNHTLQSCFWTNSVFDLKEDANGFYRPLKICQLWREE